ncbi:hypothetical protein D0S45_09955 [Marinifilum sp. JC120]|nr:hypothetical protein D0S45_09955 [Marinifilum sp. JC120]
MYFHKLLKIKSLLVLGCLLWIAVAGCGGVKSGLQFRRVYLRLSVQEDLKISLKIKKTPHLLSCLIICMGRPRPFRTSMIVWLFLLDAEQSQLVVLKDLELISSQQ